MFERQLVEPVKLLDLFRRIEDQLYRYPALSPRAFRQAVEAATRISPERSADND